ncbi:MAG TPA: FecR domain-containing protein [Rhizomicrobium sp.]
MTNRAANGDDIDTKAAAWAVRLDGIDLSETEHEALENWLQRDPRHVGALVRAQASWTDLDRMAALHAGAPRAPVQARAMFGRYARQWAMPIAASLLIAVLGLSTYSFFDGRYASDHGQVRHITLEDGSVVALDSDSVIQTRFTPQERGIYLKSGDASFQVAHNRKWPFIVHANDIAVRAVGTNFAVSLQSHQVMVTVAEGVVEVHRVDAVGPASKRVIRHDDELVAPAAHPLEVTALKPAEVARKLAWRNGLLVFDGDHLAQAAAKVNRYASVPVDIDDERLGDRAFVGVFRVGDSKAFADSAAAAFDATVDEEGGAYHLKPR